MHNTDSYTDSHTESYPLNLYHAAYITMYKTDIFTYEFPDALPKPADIDHILSNILTENEKQLIKLRYKDKKTFKEIGMINGYSLQYSRYAIRKILKKLRTSGNAKLLGITINTPRYENDI